MAAEYKQESYQVTFGFTVKRVEACWSEAKEVKCDVTENVPTGTDPMAHIRKRVAEELKRHAATAALNWRAAPAPPKVVDPLEERLPGEEEHPF